MRVEADYTVDDVAAIMCVHRTHVRRLIDSGQLEAYRLNLIGSRRRDVRITRDALDRFRRSNAVKPDAETPKRIAKRREYRRIV